MSSLILYFSGTGNTDLIAYKIRDILSSKNEDVTIFPIEQIDNAKSVHFSTLYLGFPIYGFNGPRIIYEKMAGLDLDNKSVYIFSTLAYHGGDSISRVAKLCRNLGGEVLGGQQVIMPGSDGLGFMKPDSKTVSKIIDRDFDKIPEMEIIENDIKDILAKNPIVKSKYIKEPIFFIKIIYRIFSYIMMPFEKLMSKKLLSNDNCTGCTICEQVCPLGNIIVKDKDVSFGDNCILCMRCVHQCPSEAINIGNLTIDKFKYKGPVKGKFKPLSFKKKRIM